MTPSFQQPLPTYRGLPLRHSSLRVLRAFCLPFPLPFPFPSSSRLALQGATKSGFPRLRQRGLQGVTKSGFPCLRQRGYRAPPHLAFPVLNNRGCQTEGVLGATTSGSPCLKQQELSDRGGSGEPPDPDFPASGRGSYTTHLAFPASLMPLGRLLPTCAAAAGTPVTLRGEAHRPGTDSPAFSGP